MVSEECGAHQLLLTVHSSTWWKLICSHSKSHHEFYQSDTFNVTRLTWLNAAMWHLVSWLSESVDSTTLLSLIYVFVIRRLLEYEIISVNHCRQPKKPARQQQRRNQRRTRGRFAVQVCTSQEVKHSRPGTHWWFTYSARSKFEVHVQLFPTSASTASVRLTDYTQSLMNKIPQLKSCFISEHSQVWVVRSATPVTTLNSLTV